MSAFPLDKVRAETPGIARGVFMNSSGASLRPAPVTKAVKDFLDLEDTIGSDEAIRKKAPELAQVYSSIATLTGAKTTEIALMESNTIGWHVVLAALNLAKDDEIIVSRAEYVSGLMALMELRRRLGVQIKVVEYDATGVIDLEQLQKLLSPRTRLVCLTHIPASNGTVQPVAEAGKIIRQSSDAIFLLDACQSIGQRVVDVKAIGCHALTATGRKYLRAPRGTGFLYVEADAQKKLRPAFPDGQRAALSKNNEVTPSDGARQYETYEKSQANIIGLGYAVDYALNIGLEQVQARVIHVSNYLRARIAKIDGLEVGETSSQLSGGVTFTSGAVSAADIYDHLKSRNVSLKHIRNAAGAWDFSARQRKESLRLSVHYFNTTEECDIVAGFLEEFMHT